MVVLIVPICRLACARSARGMIGRMRSGAEVNDWGLAGVSESLHDAKREDARDTGDSTGDGAAVVDGVREGLRCCRTRPPRRLRMLTALAFVSESSFSILESSPSAFSFAADSSVTLRSTSEHALVAASFSAL